MQLTTTHLILLEIAVFALIGLPFAYLFDRNGYFFYLTANVSQEMTIAAYLWTVYAFFVTMVLYYFFGADRKIKAYQARDIVPASKTAYMLGWTAAFSVASLCVFILFKQCGFSHPALSAKGLDMAAFAIKRIEYGQSINMSVYNVGLYFFTIFALTVALLILKNFWLTAATLILMGVLGTFSLQKSPLAESMLLLMFIYMLLRRPSARFLLILACCAVLIVVGLFFASGAISNMTEARYAFKDRMLYGEFGDLPYYFDFFSTKKAEFMSILPPYIQTLFGQVLPSPSRLIIEYTKPEMVLQGRAGVANTIFIGEAYAVWGIPGIIIAPFIAAFHYLVVTYIFTSLKKNIFTIFVFGYLLNRLTTALFRSFSYFLLSSIQIVIIAVIYFLVITYFTKYAKYGPSLPDAAGSER